MGGRTDGSAMKAYLGYMDRNLVWGMKEVLPLPILCKSNHPRIIYRLEKRLGGFGRHLVTSEGYCGQRQEA